MCADYQVFCEILVQRPVARSTIYLPSRMTAQDLEYMRVMAQQHFDRIMAVLKDMPRPMLLIIRYGNSCFVLVAVVEQSLVPYVCETGPEGHYTVNH